MFINVWCLVYVPYLTILYFNFILFTLKIGGAQLIQDVGYSRKYGKTHIQERLKFVLSISHNLYFPQQYAAVAVTIQNLI